MKIVTNPKKIEQALSRGVKAIYPSRKALEKALRRGKRLRIYNGIDPSNPKIHLGNALALWKMRHFQKLGHKIILLIGDFTGRIGDPSDKKAMRPQLSHRQVLENAKTYKKQAAKILDFGVKINSCEIKFNSQWLDKINNKELIELASRFTVQRLIERDLFQRRLKEKKPIGLHEFLYPIYQGYDSVAMNVDMEVGGDDQTFNMLVGRDLMKSYRKKEKFVLTVPLLEGTDGRKMSKSWGNVINITDSAGDMFGKIMSLPDNLIVKYFTLCTEVSSKEIRMIEKRLKSSKVNPKDVKIKLGREIVSVYHGKEKARVAEEEFERVFKKKKLPRNITRFKVREKKISLLNLLVKAKLTPSKSEAKRLVLQRGVKIDGKIEQGWRRMVEIKKDRVIQVGKRKFIKLIN
jgi:tyrosyl-tRNA synthetase